jgi:hypothetical protein
MTTQKYKIRYTLKIETREEDYTKEDVENENQGLCDDAIFVSIVKDKGGYSEYLMDFDGNSHGRLTENDLFKHFCMLASKLSESDNIAEWKKLIAKNVMGNLRVILAKA